jgi:ATP-dependent RNA helicase SUPV3L1/SUV3
MSQFSRSSLTAVLGPTNTGKTHLAVERMLGYHSGMIGFPLRLLAREIYDRVVAAKGERAAALLTGEERIWPTGARYLLCTAEAMPTERDPRAFMAIDETQLGQDRERGHVFTSRMLHMRGRDETMILGAGTLGPVVRGLLPEAEIISRGRFSSLRYDGPRKLSRLPPRSVIVAFSAEEVYALAEALRRFSGGAAVVMGSLSPRTRNAQVAMFQSGEVDYLVATDAIGMGLNLDVAHVGFAGLSKFDGIRQRRLTVAEMAQIAGRAGRHQRDGTFGSIGAEAAFTDAEVEAIEAHHFPPLDWLYWRNPAPRLDSLATLIADLEQHPDDPQLRAAPEATDLAVLKLLADDAAASDRVTDAEAVQRLWAVATLPDFTKVGAPNHARLVARLWADLSGPAGVVDADWFSRQLSGLDQAEGSVEVLAERIAKVRTWCYIAQRKDWLTNAAELAEAARGVETRLSDALHGALTARFVDRRTTVLLRALGQDAAALPVAVDEDSGLVRVDGEAIGTLTGFAFRVDPSARASDQRMLLAAAEKHLAAELLQRATQLAGAADDALSLSIENGAAPHIYWRGHAVAKLERGKGLLAPRVTLDPALAALDTQLALAVSSRLRGWLDDRIGTVLGPLLSVDATSRSPDSLPMLRAVLAGLVDGGGVISRHEVAESLKALSRAERVPLHRLKIMIGTLDLFIPRMLKQEAQRWRAALSAAWNGTPIVEPPGLDVQYVDHEASVPGSVTVRDYRQIGQRRMRIDLLERLAQDIQQQHKAAVQAAAEAAAAERAAAAAASPPAADEPPQPPLPTVVRRAFTFNPTLAQSVGLSAAELPAVMRQLGYRSDDPPETPDADRLWRWGGLNTRNQPRQPRRNDGYRKPRREPKIKESGHRKLTSRELYGEPPPRASGAAPRAEHSPFAALAKLFDKPSED